MEGPRVLFDKNRASMTIGAPPSKSCKSNSIFLNWHSSTPTLGKSCLNDSLGSFQVGGWGAVMGQLVWKYTLSLSEDQMRGGKLYTEENSPCPPIHVAESCGCLGKK